MAGVCGVLDDVAGLPQAPFQVDVLDGWEHSSSYVLGHLHHPLDGLGCSRWSGCSRWCSGSIWRGPGDGIPNFLRRLRK
jgi:hypothetical protein